MGMTTIDHIEREALTWLVRVNDPAFEDWSEWEDWLTTDPLHETAYWRLAEREADLVDALKLRAPKSVSLTRKTQFEPVTFRRIWPAIAAAFAIALGLGWMGWKAMPKAWTVETAAGETRTVALADGTRIDLAGSTRVVLDQRRPRTARLDEGRAVFTVAHNETSPFSVEVGDARVTDLGTVFDVTRLDRGARVVVAEGVVRVDERLAGRSRTSTLLAGDAVLVGPGLYQRRSQDPSEVLGWREGRLDYEDAPLSLIAADLSRSLGVPVSIDPEVATRRFTGSLTVRAGDPAIGQRLQRLFGVSVTAVDGGWRIGARLAT